MFFRPHYSPKALAEFCHRLGLEIDSGIDIRRTWQREAASARGAMRPAIAVVRDAVQRGESLTAALDRSGDAFPPLLREMVEVGEETGTLGQVFRRLANHYRRQSQMKRTFLAGIAWPMLQLAAAVVVIGILIGVLGLVADRQRGEAVDPLGFGLIGTPGLVVYAMFVGAIALGAGALGVAMRRGVLWTRPLQRALVRLPGIGRCVETIALAQVAWVLHLAMNSALDLRRVVPLALRATGNDYYTRHTESMVADVAAGHPLHVAFHRSGAFPIEFIDALEVAEESGKVVESMERLSTRYEEEAETALKALAMLAGFVVWALVAAVIVFLIFRLAGFYSGTIQDAVDMTR